jgi:hypothetical protein
MLNRMQQALKNVENIISLLCAQAADRARPLQGRRQIKIQRSRPDPRPQRRGRTTAARAGQVLEYLDEPGPGSVEPRWFA